MNETLIEIVVWKIRLRLNLSNPPPEDESPQTNALIAEYAEEVGRRILHYLNIEKLPDALLSVWAAMTVDLLRVEQGNSEALFGAGAGKVNGVKSITEGDTSISFGVAATQAQAAGGGVSQAVIDGIVANYAADLHRYRKMRW